MKVAQHTSLRGQKLKMHNKMQSKERPQKKKKETRHLLIAITNISVYCIRFSRPRVDFRMNYS